MFFEPQMLCLRSVLAKRRGEPGGWPSQGCPRGFGVPDLGIDRRSGGEGGARSCTSGPAVFDVPSPDVYP